MGLEVHEASDGAEALEAVRHNAFDVLVVDLAMPEASGLDVFELARRTDPEVQAIILTANASLESAIEALRLGAFDYLLKPLESLAAFELSLTRALERRHLLRENARLMAEIQRLAVTDSLTGLYNRHKLNEVLETEVERARRYGRPLSLLMIDLDDLKRINDTHGHLAGDEVLKSLARIIRSRLRRVDIATRFGGDEFVIILPEADLNEARTVADRICQDGRNLRYQDQRVSFSIGVVEYQPDINTPEEFLHAADQALYKAKRRGGGCVAGASARQAGDLSQVGTGD